MVALARHQKHYALSQAVVKSIQKSRPARAAGYVLEGDLHAGQKSWPAAIAAYRKGAAQTDGDRTAAPKLFMALLNSGDRSGAEGFAADWLKSHQKDASFRLFIGERRLAAGDKPAAERNFAEAADVDPDNAQALNNLAWLRADRGAPDALALAERAVGLAPGQAPMLDTLAKALAAAGQLDRAIAVQQNAVAAAPRLLSMQLNLARLYAKAGKREQALAQLSRLAAIGPSFAAQAEVVRLKADLGG